ncbi:tetrathionate response regulatory protein TtrR [Gallibacterium salpingitidis]|uniref:Tetrathionate response regulatory protein TtrR n=1 Tax=Gallibacterium salpingitidis TaxID=505341 RepID=A0A1A7P3S0_9PAST|nr:response regulator [Gallibacterium salpingitidis]OBW95869.1 tetrathionate response regulatory protein TtrR [Gallibacterium salpingitidis]OBX09388.1 tetrathionate response regulatory protein TtrR [Gallibacterium salpingitidis]WKS99523.1 response regulator [Gallibacterium salpingitidis]
MKVHIIDDDSTVLDAATFLLTQAGYEVTSWSNSKLFLEQAQLFEPGVVLLDMRMPYFDGRQVHKILRQQRSTLQVIIMTAFADVEMAVNELKQGAVDFLQKPIEFNQLQTALTNAAERSEKCYQQYQIQQCYDQLSEKEKEVLKLVLNGKINKQIAEELNIAVRTVEVHRSHIMEKMSAKNVAELIRKVDLLSLDSD